MSDFIMKHLIVLERIVKVYELVSNPFVLIYSIKAQTPLVYV